MNIDITARHDHLTDKLWEHATERLAHALRHAESITSAHVILDHERTRSIAEIVVRGRNLAAVVMADGDDHFVALDRCADKLRHQIDHHVGRHKDRRRRAASLRANEVELAAIASLDEQDVRAGKPARSKAVPLPVHLMPEAAAPAAAPDVVRTQAANLPALSLEAAFSSLDDSDLEFLVYRDPVSSRVSVLYRRVAGQVGLIETGAA